jgi:aromatic ring hydroxylase
MRTGAEYREAMRDGRRVWIMGEGPVDDLTTHPATAAMVEEYVRWYDQLRNPAWAGRAISPAQIPWAYTLPQSAADLAGMGRYFAATLFESAGNITHTPAYGNLIAMGVMNAVAQYGAAPPAQREAAAHYRKMIAETGHFLTFCGGSAPIGHRLRPDPAERRALHLVRETDAGIVVSGRIGMHTSPPFAEAVYVGGLNGVQVEGHPASFIVPIGAPGVLTICRKPAVRDKNPFVAPLSTRFDELDGQIWLDDVFVPWEHVFFVEEGPEPVARWLIWHHLHGWLAKAEFALGLALACADAMGFVEHQPTVEYVVDIVAEVQTVRSCLYACEHDCVITPEGWAAPNHTHLAAGGIALLKARQRIAEILRILPGSSLVVTPSDRDLAAPELAEGLEDSFGGGGYTAAQRAALLQMAWDHVSSALDGRESAFELHASGGIPAWRGRLRRVFADYNHLANAVLRNLALDMPKIDVSPIPDAPIMPRRVNTAPPR